MSNYTVRTVQTDIDPKERARRLAAVYQFIISLPDPKERKTEPVSDPGADVPVSETGTSAEVDGNLTLTLLRRNPSWVGNVVLSHERPE